MDGKNAAAVACYLHWPPTRTAHGFAAGTVKGVGADMAAVMACDALARYWRWIRFWLLRC